MSFENFKTHVAANMTSFIRYFGVLTYEDCFYDFLRNSILP